MVADVNDRTTDLQDGDSTSSNAQRIHESDLVVSRRSSLVPKDEVVKRSEARFLLRGEAEIGGIDPMTSLSMVTLRMTRFLRVVLKVMPN